MLTGSYLKFTIKLKQPFKTNIELFIKCGIKITPRIDLVSPVPGQLALATSISERICKDPHNPPGGDLNSSELLNTPVGGLIFLLLLFAHAN